MKATAHRAALAGRPREFDIDDAILDAMNVFWKQGYHATSLPDLLDATGLSRGSLYKGFGDKKSLFLRALDRYTDDSLEALAETLATPGTARDAIRAALMRYVGLSCDEGGRRGCLVIATAMEMLPHDPEMAARVARTLRRIQDLFAATISKGQAAGVIPADRNARDLARFLVCQIQGMKVVGKTGAGRREMEHVIDIALRCVD
jgi:TetR/AcrR family transcriptional repressor of nem operon